MVVVCVSVQQLDPPQQEQLNAALTSVAQQLRRLADVSWLCPVIDPSDHEVSTWSTGSRSTGSTGSIHSNTVCLIIQPLDFHKTWNRLI